MAKVINKKKVAAKPVKAAVKKVVSKKPIAKAKPVAKKTVAKVINKKKVTAKPVKAAVKKVVAKKPIAKAKPVAKKPVEKVINKKKVTAKPVKAAVKKVVAKKPIAKAKPVAKKTVAKVINKKKVTAKPAKVAVKKAVSKKPIAKAKPIEKKVVAKAKTVVQKTAVKAVKPVEKKSTKKTEKPTISNIITKKIISEFPKGKTKIVVAKIASPKIIEKVKSKKTEVIKPEPKKTEKATTSRQKEKSSKIETASHTIFTNRHNENKPKMETSVVRYSDADLVVFKEIVLKKIAKAKEEIDFYVDQIKNSSESETQFASIDDGSLTSERENMNQIVVRMQKLISHLESALVRIENKSYGICRETGKLIPKERLLVVPHATLSVEGKKMEKK